ncbi:MAG: exosortase family protein XrtF [Flavobacteriaceae bacterium]|nr:exosortase family protein XrtF [Flavobacteriaceae bacterium]
MKKKKTIVKFLLKFFITYAVLVLAYNFYLDKTQQRGDVFSCSPITQTVAYHTQKLANLFGYEATVYQHEGELSMKFFLGDHYSFRLIEGCNSVSIIILFLAFIIAFSGSIPATILFGIVGGLVIYVMNLIRLVVISVLTKEYPQYDDFLHDLLFPAIIYGTVLLLWIIWVNRFSYLKKPKREKKS